MTTSKREYGPGTGDRTGWLIEILLPLAYNDGAPIPDELLDSVRGDLVAQFGGLTAFNRSPAEGIWVSNDAPRRDEIVFSGSHG